MNLLFIENQEFNNINYTNESLPKGEYEHCSFKDCLFLGSDLSDIIFSESIFENCDLSNALLKNTAFKDVRFTNSKLLGLHFDDCNPFLLEFSFEYSVLNYSSFYKLKMKKTHFKSCKMKEVDFVETDLNGSIFYDCDLLGTLFENSNLEKCDFYTSYNYQFNPDINRLKKAKFSVRGVAGLLSKYDISIDP